MPPFFAAAFAFFGAGTVGSDEVAAPPDSAAGGDKAVTGEEARSDLAKNSVVVIHSVVNDDFCPSTM